MNMNAALCILKWLDLLLLTTYSFTDFPPSFQEYALTYLGSPGACLDKSDK